MAVAAAEERLIGGQPIICSSGYPEELYIEKQAEDWVSLSGDLEPNRGYLLLSKMDLWEPSWSAEEGFIAPWSGTTFQATAPMKYFQLVKEPTDTLVFIEKIQDAIEPVSGVPGSGRNAKFQIWRERAHGVYDSSLTVHFTIGGTAVNGSDFAEGIAPEDFDIIPAGQALYCNDGIAGNIYKVPAAYFTEYVGDLLITQAGEVQDFPAVLLIFHWDGSRFVKKSVFPPEGALFEHVTFAPVDL